MLSAVNEDAGAPSGAVGTLVSSLVDFATPSGQVDNVTDVDSGALLGIAITAAATADGTWHSSIDNGASWTTVGAVSDASSRLLAADGSTRLYFQPNSNFNGTVNPGITFRAWDRTSGTNGTLASTAANGGTTAFSSATDTADITVNSVNDHPTLDPIGNKPISEQATLSFTVGASDPADPTQTLTFSLDAAALALGMTIDPVTGAFSWTPTEAQGGTNYPVTITVTDNGTNPNNLTAGERITIEVADVSGPIVPIYDPLRGEWILQVFGTTGDDSIQVKPANNPDAVRVIVNGVTQDIVVRGSSQPAIARFVVYGDEGNDVIQVSGHLNMLGVPAELRGGPGDDNIRGGAGPDLIFGETGDDLLVGNEGRDLLVGGLGADRIVGNEQDDILISGYTVYDLNVIAMDAIFDEWRSSRDYDDRVANIRGDGAADRLNGNYFLMSAGASVNVHDDGVADVLTGNDGLDWFFANLDGDNSATKDKIKDLSAEEFADDLDFILGGP